MSTQIKYLSFYHPYKGGNNDKFNQNSKMILDFKQGNDLGVTYWAPKVSQHLSLIKKPFYLATVPSSTAGKEHPGFAKLFSKLKEKHNLLNDKGNLLERKSSIPKLASGGNRSKATQLQTMSAIKPKHKNLPVVLIDDVTTTGNSLNASIELLMEAQYDIIAVVALGKTQHVP